jgi:Peptidase family M28
VAAAVVASGPADEGSSAYEAAAHISGKIGARPEGSRGERRAHDYVAERFRAAGLQVGVSPFGVPGRRPSRNVIGRLDTPSDCLTVLMAHTDNVPPGLGAIDNASGVGVLIALAPRLAGLNPPCDVWLVATGSEERTVTGLGYHAGSAALVQQIKAEGWAAEVRFALSIDEVGLGRRFYLRSPHSQPREGVEGGILSAARRANVTVRWVRDSGTGNSDHREFELAGLPAAVLELWKGEFRCHHMACDRPRLLQRRALNRALRVAEEVVKG